MHKGLTPLALVMCDKNEEAQGQCLVIEQEEKGRASRELEATQRRFRGGSEGAVEATTLGIEKPSQA